jgi:hypothetical protein
VLFGTRSGSGYGLVGKLSSVLTTARRELEGSLGSSGLLFDVYG